MKRTFKRPDGTEEQVEGTAEELAEYERRLRGEISEQKRPPPVLRGAELDGEPVTDQEVEWIRTLRRLRTVPSIPEYPTYPIPQPIVTYKQWTTNRTWIPCKYCGEPDCHKSHIICDSVAGVGGPDGWHVQ